MGPTFHVVSECPTPKDPSWTTKLIGTHDNVFHCDEALGCAMLQMMPEWAGSTIVRTRDKKELDKCDIVIDVGAVYDHNALRYDHHQHDFRSTLSDYHTDVAADSRPEGFSTRLSACGLIYKHYGLSVLLPVVLQGIDCPKEALPAVYRKVYSGFVQEIDAIDNGINMTEGETKYRIYTHLSARVASLNPAWNEDGSKSRRNELFKEAMKLTGDELYLTVRAHVLKHWPARRIVKTGMENRWSIDPSGEIMLLERSCPWQEHLEDLEAEEGVQGQLKYVLFSGPDGKWYARAVPPVQYGNGGRKPLPATWRGRHGKELSSMAGIDGCRFCHRTGFLGVNETYEGALQMARAGCAFVDS